jgi:hypothetical protein
MTIKFKILGDDGSAQGNKNGNGDDTYYSDRRKIYFNIYLSS